MKYIKLFESFNNEIKIGDMVYVDHYGSYTLMYNSAVAPAYTGPQRNIPFRPLVYNDYYGISFKFDPNTQYEVIYIETPTSGRGSQASLYDDDNNLITINCNNLYKEKIDCEMIKDYFVSSFEDIIDISNVKYKNYINLVDIQFEIPDSAYRIYYNEFSNRMEDEGYKSGISSYGKIAQIIVTLD